MFLNKYPLIIATAIIGVKFGGWGINLANARINIKLIGKISFFKVFNNFCITLIYLSYAKIESPDMLKGMKLGFDSDPGTNDASANFKPALSNAETTREVRK